MTSDWLRQAEKHWQDEKPAQRAESHAARSGCVGRSARGQLGIAGAGEEGREIRSEHIACGVRKRAERGCACGRRHQRQAQHAVQRVVASHHACLCVRACVGIDPLDFTGRSAHQRGALRLHHRGCNGGQAREGKPGQYPARHEAARSANGTQNVQYRHGNIINQAGILAAMRSLFHLAFNVTDLDVARRFYGDVLGCVEGRSTATWVDFDFAGHQLSLHLGAPFQTERTGHVGEHLVPMPHFGLVLALPDWQVMAKRLTDAQVEFVLQPQVRFEGQSGEQWTLFFLDPFGNPIEIKGFRSLDTVYAA